MSRIHRVIKAFINKEAVHKFGCLYAPLPRALADNIYAWGRDNISDGDLFFPREGDGGREQNLHVTVKYGIHINDPMEIQQFLSANPVTLIATLGAITTFDQKDHQVVKIDVNSRNLSRLNQMVSSSFEVTDTYPEYIPHVTIAYVKSGRGSRFIGREDFKGERVVLDRLAFTGSDDRTTIINL